MATRVATMHWRRFADQLSDTNPETITGLRPSPRERLDLIWVKLGTCWWKIQDPFPVLFDESSRRQGGPVDHLLADPRTGTETVDRAIRMLRTRVGWKPMKFDNGQIIWPGA